MTHMVPWFEKKFPPELWNQFCPIKQPSEVEHGDQDTLNWLGILPFLGVDI